MDDTLAENFFRQPVQVLHRRYEALRAFFVDHRSLADIAREFRYSYGTLRNVVSQFRRQCEAGEVAPFLPRRATDDHRTRSPFHQPDDRKQPPSPTAANSAGLPVANSAPA